MLEAVGVSGRVIVDDFFITIIKDGVGGVLNKVSTRLQSGYAGEKRIPMDTVSSVQFKAVGSAGDKAEGFYERVGVGNIARQLGAGATGYIQFGIVGAGENKSRMLGNAFSKIGADENTVTFMKSQEDDFKSIRDFVDAKIVARMAGRTSPAPASPVSKLDQLKQLGELRDSGILTQEEFESEKQKIMGS